MSETDLNALAKEAHDASQWMRTTAHFLRNDYWPTADKAKETFIVGIEDAGKRFYALADALTAAATPRSEWCFDMSKAPDDGSSVIIAVKSYNRPSEFIVSEAHYLKEDGGWWWAQTSPGDYYASPISETNGEVTAWQPLPSPPTEPGK